MAQIIARLRLAERRLADPRLTPEQTALYVEVWEEARRLLREHRG